MSFPIEHFPDANFPEAHFPHGEGDPVINTSFGTRTGLGIGIGIGLCLLVGLFLNFPV